MEDPKRRVKEGVGGHRRGNEDIANRGRRISIICILYF
jgi:hypothetical protein